MKLKFHDYDYFLSLPYYQNEDNVKAEADKYIQHKIDRDGYYSYSGYPSVTSVLSMMNPDQEMILERWRAKLRKQGLDPAKVSRNYADIGTAIHYAIGSRISFPIELEPPKWSIDEYPDNCEEYVGNGIYMWNLLTRGDNPTLTIESATCEIYGKNEKYKYAGIYDLYGIVNGKRTILDFKTSPKCKPDYLLQLGAYSLFQNKMPEQGIIVNLCPDDRNPDLRPSVTIIDEEQLQQAADSWVSMISAFHAIFDEYLPVVKRENHDAPIRNAMQKSA